MIDLIRCSAMPEKMKEKAGVIISERIKALGIQI